jgi:hypothetical protein
MKTYLSIYSKDTSDTGIHVYKTGILFNPEKRTFKFARYKHNKFMRDQINFFGSLEKLFIGRYVSVAVLDNEKLLAYVNSEGEYSLIPAHKLPMTITKIEEVEQIQNYRGDVRNLFALWMI